MATFTITFAGSSYDESKRTEDVEADNYIDEGEWITFRKSAPAPAMGYDQVLRVRSKDVERIDRKG